MVISKKTSIINYFVFFVGLLFLGGFYPALWNYVAFGDYAIYISLVFLIVWCIILLIQNHNLKIYKVNSIFLFFIITLFFYYIFRLFIFGDVITYILLVLITSCMAITLSHSTIGNRLFMSLLTNFQIIIILCSIIGIILLYAGLLGPPKQIVLSTYEDKIFLNYKFFFVKSGAEREFIPLFLRSSGFYDEPGSFAFVNLLLLIYNKRHIKNKNTEFVLLFGGLITLSAAHIITVILYLLLFYTNKKHFWIFLLVILIFVGIYFLPLDQEWFVFFKSRTYDRIINIFQGTDNSRNFDSSFEAFKTFFITGGSSNEILKAYPLAYTDTIWFTLASNGIIGSIIYYSPIIYILIKSVKKGFFSVDTKLTFLLLINFIQRPNYINPIYLLIIYFTWFYRPSLNLEKSVFWKIKK